MSRVSPGHPAARAAAVCTRFAVFAALCIGTAGAQPVSLAEVLLFETDHLAKTEAPATLVYEFRKRSNVEPAFTDSVELDVSRSKGQMHAALHFFSGKRRRDMPEVNDAHGNPVVLGFLEHDIAEMKRLTGGSVTYFRKRIRMALAETAQVTAQRITYQGKTVEAKMVRVQPFLDDPMHARFENYVRKTYTFILSDAVPGGLYQVSTSLANTEGSRPAPGTVVARTAAPGPATPGAGPGAAAAAAAAAATAGKSASGKPVPGNAVPGAAVSAAAPAAAQPGAAAPGAVIPVIEETLTLVKVVAPRR